MTSMASENRSVVTDITVYGATGFVGRHVCMYLLSAADKNGIPVRLTLAGRNLQKLEARKRDLDAGKSAIDVFVADSKDLPALVNMAKRTKVILNCAGPFYKYSTFVVAAAAETGADYVDITGEFTWAGRMRAQYGSAAKKSGSRIISLCGFDSVPSDISIFAAVQALREENRSEVELASGCTWHAAVGFMNGGTLHTALEFPLNIRHCIMSGETNGSKFRKVPFMMDDPMVLSNPVQVRHNPDYGTWKDKMALSEWWNQFPTFDSIVRGGMSLPFLMAPVNSKVVYASAAALKYGPSFTYRERFYPIGFRWTRNLSIFSAVPALLFQFGLLLASALFKLPLIGKKLADILLPPGSGLPDAVLEPCHAEIYAEVVTKEDASGHIDRATCFVGFQGDPGNLVTAQCVSECALALVYNKKELPPRSEDGFGTPAELLGDALLKRLKESKVRKVHFRTCVHRKAPKHENKVHL